MSDYEKVRAIHNWISHNTLYDRKLYARERIDTDPDFYRGGYNKSFNMEGVFFEGVAVCDGIAQGFNLMASMVEIETVHVIGDISGELHAWNKVNIDYNGDGEKNWCHVNVTWDMPSRANSEGVLVEYIRERYLITTYDQISSSHELIDYWGR